MVLAANFVKFLSGIPLDIVFKVIDHISVLVLARNEMLICVVIKLSLTLCRAIKPFVFTFATCKVYVAACIAMADISKAAVINIIIHQGAASQISNGVKPAAKKISNL